MYFSFKIISLLMGVKMWDILMAYISATFIQMLFLKRKILRKYEFHFNWTLLRKEIWFSLFLNVHT